MGVFMMKTILSDTIDWCKVSNAYSNHNSIPWKTDAPIVQTKGQNERDSIDVGEDDYGGQSARRQIVKPTLYVPW